MCNRYYFWFIESKTYTASEVFRGNFSAEGGVLEIIHLKEREQISDEIQTEVSLSKEQQYELIRLLEQAEYKKVKYFEFGYSQYLLSLKSPSVHMLFYDAITASIKVKLNFMSSFKINILPIVLLFEEELNDVKIYFGIRGV